MTADSRALLYAMFDAAIAAAHPDSILPPHLPEPPPGRILVLGAGKAGGAMAAAAEAHYFDTLGLDPRRLAGSVTTRHGHGKPTRVLRIVEAGHPVPDEAGRQAAADTLALAATATPDDVLLVLLSGGGSANWVAPADGIDFAQKQALTRALLRSGAAIGEINTVRKHLSRIKGGRLAYAGRAAREIVTLAISDVPHDDPAVIASGPTVPDPTTLADARAIVARFSLDLDPAVAAALADPANESIKPDNPAFARARFVLIGRPRDSLDAACALAQEAGYAVVDLGADLEGEARDVGAAHAELARRAQEDGRRVAFVSGGELTVTVRGQGRGGPNQEYALALAQHLRGVPDIAALAGDTDGADGGGGSAEDPAGALLDAAIFAEIDALGLDPRGFLADNDATGFFAAAGGLVQTGPTLTNVNDIRIILVN